MKPFLGVALALALTSCGLDPALAQNAPLSALPPRGTVQPTDIIPCQPASGPLLMQCPVSSLITGTPGPSGVTPGSYTNTSLTVNAEGLVTAASSGTTGGSVTGVTVTVPGFSCPTTGSGNLTISCTVNVSADEIYAGPCSGSAALPTFRALCEADLPASGVAAGTYSNIISLGVNTAGQVTSIVAGPGCTASCGTPTLASFSWVNQGPATAVQPIAGGPIGVVLPDSAGAFDWRALVLAVPSCPWKVIISIKYSMPSGANAVANGLYLYNGTALIGYEFEYGSTGFRQRVEHITNVNTDGSTAFTSAVGATIRNDYAGIQGNLQIRDDCTNYYFDSSEDGIIFATQYSEAIGSYMTATYVGFGGEQSQNSTNGYISMNNWQFYPDANLNGP